MPRAEYYQLHKRRCLKTQSKWKLKHPKYAKIYDDRRKKRHPSYVNWSRMMVRCYNGNFHSYARYGGRGIKVYTPWRTFSCYESEFGRLKPGKDYTVDRIYSDMSYMPGNVRWVTKSENSRRIKPWLKQ